MCMELVVGSLAFKIKGKGKGKPVPKGMRKPIRGFSAEAKRNLLWRLQTLDFNRLMADGWTGWFITLTYRDVFYFEAKSLRDVKDDLKKFFTYFSRSFPLRFFSFWKMEFTKKGVPHFHLFMCVECALDHDMLIEFVEDAWLKATGVQGEHLQEMKKASTNVRFSPFELQEVIQAYVSKEVGKTYQVDVPDNELPGRFWGIYGRELYKQYVKEDRIELDKQDFFKARRIVWRWLKSKGYKVSFRGRYQGITAYYVDADKFCDKLLKYLGYQEGLRCLGLESLPPLDF